MNRFVWNLRYDDPVQIPGAFYAGLPPRGPLVLPGNYTIKLTYDGQTQTVPLTVAARSARPKGSLAGLQQKFALSMEVYHDQDALHRAVNDIRAVQGARSRRRSRAQRATRQTARRSRRGQLAAAAQPRKSKAVLMQVNIKGSEANLNFPGMLNEQIYSFAGLLDDADTAPNTPEVETYAGLHASLGAQLAAWDGLKRRQVSAFCAHARSAGVRDSSTSACP